MCPLHVPLDLVKLFHIPEVTVPGAILRFIQRVIVLCLILQHEHVAMCEGMERASGCTAGAPSPSFWDLLGTCQYGNVACSLQKRTWMRTCDSIVAIGCHHHACHGDGIASSIAATTDVKRRFPPLNSMETVSYVQSMHAKE